MDATITGTGIAMVRSPAVSIVGVYFSRHRGLATSIYSGSASVGGIIFAPVVTNPGRFAHFPVRP